MDTKIATKTHLNHIELFNIKQKYIFIKIYNNNKKL